jgi:hypothetical protein
VWLDVRRQQFSEVAQGDAMTHLYPLKTVKLVFWSIHMTLLIFFFQGGFFGRFSTLLLMDWAQDCCDFGTSSETF